MVAAGRRDEVISSISLSIVQSSSTTFGEAK
jgi:hypothetical protein